MAVDPGHPISGPYGLDGPIEALTLDRKTGVRLGRVVTFIGSRPFQPLAGSTVYVPAVSASATGTTAATANLSNIPAAQSGSLDGATDEFTVRVKVDPLAPGPIAVRFSIAGSGNTITAAGAVYPAAGTSGDVTLEPGQVEFFSVPSGTNVATAVCPAVGSTATFVTVTPGN